MRRQSLADKLDNREDIWAEVKRLRPQQRVNPPSMDDVHGERDIADLFAEKFETLYCSTPTISLCIRKPSSSLTTVNLW